MSTKTITFQFQISSTLTDVTSVVLRDPTSTFGIERTDTHALVVAANTALTHISTGLYSYTFTEPAAGLNYEYWLEYVYAGNTKRLRQVLETIAGGGAIVPPSLATYAQLGVDTVSCGDATLAAFLTGQADLVWAMQTRRGVALDLLYQYYVVDLITLAMDHVRMLIESEVGVAVMADRNTQDSLQSSHSSSVSASTRTSSNTESALSRNNSVRSSSRSSSSTSSMDGSNSAYRNASSSDYSTTSSAMSGHSERHSQGASTTMGFLDFFGTAAKSKNSSLQSTISKTKYSGSGYIDGTGAGASLNPVPPISPTETDYSSIYATINANVASISSASYSRGAGKVIHEICPSVLGRIRVSGGLDDDGAHGDLSNLSSSSSDRATLSAGSQLGGGTSLTDSSGTRTNNRSSSSVAHSESAMLGSSASSQTSVSHSKTTASASSAAHSESAGNSTMTASGVSHSESVGVGAMTSSGSVDREYYNQIFESLQQMFDDTKELIQQLEKMVLLPLRYLSQRLGVITPQTVLVGRAAALSDITLIQRPGIPRQSPFIGAWERWIVR